ncbi:MAG: peptide chain release factor N(5)-glutamine methyltransferase, partial [Spirochaetota bacterium]
ARRQSDGTTVRAALRQATERIGACLAHAPAGSAETPHLDALVLLSHALGEPTERVMASFPDELPGPARTRFAAYVEQRCAGLPVSYIRGEKEFYGREFVVSPAVLVPRPDTEILVEEALRLVDLLAATDRSPSRAPLHVHDACTGSGCIAATIAAERPSLRVSASDLDENALEVARTNVSRLVGERVAIWRSDLLSQLADESARCDLPMPQIITANPPYLTDTEYTAMREAGWPEPARALAGGDDGLAVVRELAAQAVTALPHGGYLVSEMGPEQGAAVRAIFETAGLVDTRIRADLAGRDRVVIGRRP